MARETVRPKSLHKALEEYPLMGGVLVEQDHGITVIEDQKAATHLTNETQRLNTPPQTSLSTGFVLGGTRRGALRDERGRVG